MDGLLYIHNAKSDNEIIPGQNTDLLAFTLQMRKTMQNLSYEMVNQDYAISHLLK